MKTIPEKNKNCLCKISDPGNNICEPKSIGRKIYEKIRNFAHDLGPYRRCAYRMWMQKEYAYGY